MILWSEGSPQGAISPGQAKAALVSALESLGRMKRVLAVPPDCTRAHSQAGPLTEAVDRGIYMGRATQRGGQGVSRGEA